MYAREPGVLCFLAGAQEIKEFFDLLREYVGALGYTHASPEHAGDVPLLKMYAQLPDADKRLCPMSTLYNACVL